MVIDGYSIIKEADKYRIFPLGSKQGLHESVLDQELFWHVNSCNRHIQKVR